MYCYKTLFFWETLRLVDFARTFYEVDNRLQGLEKSRANVVQGEEHDEGCDEHT